MTRFECDSQASALKHAVGSIRILSVVCGTFHFNYRPRVKCIHHLANDKQIQILIPILQLDAGGTRDNGSPQIVTFASVKHPRDQRGRKPVYLSGGQSV